MTFILRTLAAILCGFATVTLSYNQAIHPQSYIHFILPAIACASIFMASHRLKSHYFSAYISALVTTIMGYSAAVTDHLPKVFAIANATQFCGLIALATIAVFSGPTLRSLLSNDSKADLSQPKIAWFMVGASVLLTGTTFVFGTAGLPYAAVTAERMLFDVSILVIVPALLFHIAIGIASNQRYRKSTDRVSAIMD